MGSHRCRRILRATSAPSWKKKTNWFIMKYQGGSLHLSQICCRVICFWAANGRLKRGVKKRRRLVTAEDLSKIRWLFSRIMGKLNDASSAGMFCVNKSLSNALNLTVNGFNHVQLEHARDDGSFEIIVKFENVVYFDRRQPVDQYLLDSSSTLKYWLKLLLWLKR